MGCASSKHQMMRKAVAKMSSDHQTNATCTDSERTYTERTYCDKENRSAMMTTATGEVTKIETVKPPGRLSTVRRSSRSKSSKVGPTPTTGSSCCETGGGSRSRSKKTTAACGGGESSSKHRRESPPIQIRRVSKIDRTAKTHPGSLELDNSSAHSSRSTSEHSAVMFKANCDRQSLAAALDHFDLEDFSNHTSSSHYHEDPLICIVRSDKLAFSGAGIRRHSRRKRHRQLGKDNTKIVILRQPSFKEQAAMAAAEEAATKANKDLEDECAKQRSDRRLTRRAAANARKSTTTDRATVGDRRRTKRGSTTATTKRNNNNNNNNKVVEHQHQLSPNGTPVRSNSVLRGGSSSGVMMFEDKSSEADLDYWPLPLTAVQ